MEESPFENVPITAELLREDVFKRIEEARSRAYAIFIQDCVENPVNIKTLTLRFIGEIFDAAAYWTHFIYAKKPDGEESYERALNTFIKEAEQKGWEMTAHWSPVHNREEFHSLVAIHLHGRRHYWMAEVIKRVREHKKREPVAVILSPQPIEASTHGGDEKLVPEPQAVAIPPNARQSFVDPILEEKGFSILDWANKSEVTYHTAADYLSGTTNPYRSTRLKLAKGLGVSVDRLPK